MKFLTTVFFVVCISASAFSQVDLRAGMGINFASTPSLNDYLNQSNFAPPTDQVATFNSSVIFSGEADYFLNDKYEIGLEIAYLLNSFNYSFGFGKYEFAYDIIMPTATAYYVLKGSGYNFKFGGGLGLRFTGADETLPPTTVATTYNATGFGVLLRLDGNTSLGGDFYANIGGDIRYDLNGKPKNGNDYLVNPVTKENVNLNSFSVGVRLGISYIF